MSEKESQTASKYVGALFIAIVLLVILLGSIGFVWARSNAEREILSSTGAVESPAETNRQSSEQLPISEAAIPQASAAAPVAPTAVATSDPEPTSFPQPTFSNPVDDRLIEEAAAWGADFVHVDGVNSGVWQYETNSFIRPVALEASSDMAYLLDGGRVLALNLAQPEPPVALLVPGDSVDGVRVLEPLDLALEDDTLFVLDRAGDVYRYDLIEGNWNLDRYDRPVEASSGHYFVALDVASNSDEEGGSNPSRTLLETNYNLNP